MDNVDQVFGLHVAPQVPVGVIALASGPITAASDTFIVTIKGRAVHSSTPYLAVDPILIGAEIVTNLHHIVARNVSPLENVVISIGEFCSGKTANVIPETARIQGSVRTNDPKNRLAVKNGLKK